MTIGVKIRDEKLQYGYLNGEEILPTDQSRITEQVKVTYSPLR